MIYTKTCSNCREVFTTSAINAKFCKKKECQRARKRTNERNCAKNKKNKADPIRFPEGGPKIWGQKPIQTKKSSVIILRTKGTPYKRIPDHVMADMVKLGLIDNSHFV